MFLYGDFSDIFNSRLGQSPGVIFRRAFEHYSKFGQPPFLSLQPFAQASRMLLCTCM